MGLYMYNFTQRGLSVCKFCNLDKKMNTQHISNLAALSSSFAWDNDFINSFTSKVSDVFVTLYVYNGAESYL